MDADNEDFDIGKAEAAQQATDGSCAPLHHHYVVTTLCHSSLHDEGSARMGAESSDEEDMDLTSAELRPHLHYHPIMLTS